MDVDLPYEQCTVTCSGNDAVKNSSVRPTFEYNGQYYRVDEVCFSDKPFIVIEYGTYDELMNNAMEDAEPFPYNLTEEELLNEVKYSLGIEGIFFYLYDLYELKRLFPRLPQPLLLQASALPTAPPLSVCCRSRRMRIRTVGLNTGDLAECIFLPHGFWQ